MHAVTSHELHLRVNPEACCWECIYYSHGEPWRGLYVQLWDSARQMCVSACITLFLNGYWLYKIKNPNNSTIQLEMIRSKFHNTYISKPMPLKCTMRAADYTFGLFSQVSLYLTDFSLFSLGLMRWLLPSELYTEMSANYHWPDSS